MSEDPMSLFSRSAAKRSPSRSSPLAKNSLSASSTPSSTPQTRFVETNLIETSFAEISSSAASSTHLDSKEDSKKGAKGSAKRAVSPFSSVSPYASSSNCSLAPAVARPSKQASEPGAPLPADWRDKISEISKFIEQMRHHGSEIAQRHQMSDHEFEAFMNNSSNFTSEEWHLICQAREHSRQFVDQMKELLADYKPGHKKAKKQKGGVSRGWISVD